MQRILIFISALLLAFAPTMSFAQESYSIPELYITDVSVISNGTVDAGQTVKGSFTIHNVESHVVADLSFISSLAGQYNDGGAPEIIYSSSKKESIGSLDPKSKKTINFSYTIPKNVSKDAGIHIDVFNDADTRLIWGDVEFEINGAESLMLTIGTIEILVNDVSFKPDSGPTIKSTDTGIFKASWKNQTTQDVTLVPTVTIHERSLSENPIKTEALNEVTVAAGEELTLEHFINTTFEPGVYVAQLRLVDANLSNFTPPIPFRYIIDGVTGQIHDVVSPQLSVESGDVFTVNISYTGVPVNITTFVEEGESVTAELIVTATDVESGEQVGNTTHQFELDESGTAFVSIAADRESDHLAYDVVLQTQAGKQLDSYSVEFPPAPEDEIVSEIPYMIISIILLIIFIIIIILIPRSKKQTVTSAAIILLGLSVSIGIIGYHDRSKNVDNAIALTEVYSDGNEGGQHGTWRSFEPQGVILASPQPPEVKTYKPGESFNFQIDFVAAACNNGWQDVSVYSLQKMGWEKGPDSSILTKDISHSGSHRTYVGKDKNWDWWKNSGVTVQEFDRISGSSNDHKSSNRDFATNAEGGYKVPIEPGDYRFYFYIYNDMRWDYGSRVFGSYLGYQDIRIVDPDVCPNISGVQEVIPEGFSLNDGDCEGSLTAVCEFSPDPVIVGRPVQAIARISGGDETYETIEWSADFSGNNITSESRTFNTIGNYVAALRVSDGKDEISVQCPFTVVEDDFAVACTASPLNPEPGDVVTWNAKIKGEGDSSLTYRWSGAASGSRRTVTARYDDEGVYTASLRITDREGVVDHGSCKVSVREGGGSSTGGPSTGGSSTASPATGSPATGNPATGNPATGNPATGNPATGDPATGDPGIDIKDFDVREI